MLYLTIVGIEITENRHHLDPEAGFERPSFVENEKVMGERGWSRGVPCEMGGGWQLVERRGGHPGRKSGGECWQMTMR